MTVESVLVHGLKTSVFGSQWNAEHGDNLALLDPDRITSNLLANRPAAGVAHRFFFATDSQKLYYDTGAAWIEQTATSVAHAASHASGGADAVTLAQSQVTNLAADLAGKEAANANIQAHIASTANPHATTAAQVGLGNAENKSFAVGVADAAHLAANKATPVDADELPLVDSAASNVLKKLTWANLKATLKTYLDTLYVALTGNQTIAGVKTFSDPTDASSSTAGGTVASGGLAVAKKIYNGDTTDASAGAGSIVTAGGIAVGKKIYAADNVVLASGKGIDFSATANGSGSMTSELFSDYEEGTWTPTDASGAALSITSLGRYTKIGRIVFVSFDITYPSTANGSNAKIGGLPFTVKPGTPYETGGIGYKDCATDLALMTDAAGTALFVTGGAGYRTNAQLTTARIMGHIAYSV